MTSKCTCPHGDEKEPDHDSECPARIIKELRAEIQRLKDRPPMSCMNCEELNLRLADELETVERWKSASERESLAWNAWLEVSGANDWSTDEEMKAWMDGSSEKVKQAREKFEVWWEHNKFFQ